MDRSLASFPLRTLSSFALLAALSATSLNAVGQSAEDKNTARNLAREAIKAFKAKDYTTCLDRANRAQALYDAPIHVLYIARCQRQVGDLVGAAESYRTLARTKLGEDAPEVFKRAVATAQPELGEFESTIPKLTLTVAPKGVEGLVIKVNGKRLNTAVLGIPRSTNPGQAEIVVGAPGYQTARVKVDIAEGESKSHAVTLKKGQSDLSEAEKTEAPDADDGKKDAEVKIPDPMESDLDLYLEVRGGGAFTSGNVGTLNRFRPDQEGSMVEELAMDNIADVGGGLELRAGLHFVRIITGYLSLQLNGLRPGDRMPIIAFDYLDENAVRQNVGRLAPGATTDSQTGLHVSLGLGARVSTPRDWRFGGFVELGAQFFNVYQTEFQTTGALTSGATVQCNGTATFMGAGGAHAGLGGIWNLTDLFALTVSANFDLVGFDNVNLDASCDSLPVQDVDSSDGRELEDTSLGFVGGLAVGGQFMIPLSQHPKNAGE